MLERSTKLIYSAGSDLYRSAVAGIPDSAADKSVLSGAVFFKGHVAGKEHMIVLKYIADICPKHVGFRTMIDVVKE